MPRIQTGWALAVHLRRVIGSVALHQVDEDLGLQVHQAGGVDGRMRRLGRQVAGLVDTQLAHGPHAFGVVDEGRAVFDHRVHHRPPAHAQLGRHHRHRPGLLAHLPARLNAGAAGEHGLSVDVG
jgi:hypothetical protein